MFTLPSCVSFLTLLPQKPAQDDVRKVLKQIKITLPEKHLIYSNVTGQPYTSIDEIRYLIVQQIVSPVQWHATIKDMQDTEHIDRFVECGPMTALSSILRSIDPQLSNDKILSSDKK